MESFAGAMQGKYHKIVYAHLIRGGMREKAGNGQKSFYPRLPYIKNNHFWQLYTISVPVLGINSEPASQQGKIYIACCMRRMLFRKGYPRRPSWGTEPSALLFRH